MEKDVPEMDLNKIKLKTAKNDEVDLARDALEFGHYLGDCKPSYRRIYQIAEYKGEIIAVLLWDQSVKHNAARDAYIGWDKTTRKENCIKVVNNKRFCISEHYKGVPNLGSKILGLAVKDLKKTWQEKYNYELLLCETYVDGELYQGTSYLAAGWADVGRSKGYKTVNKTTGEQETTTSKKVFVKELREGARTLLKTSSATALVVVDDKNDCVDFSKLNLKELGSRLGQLPDYRSKDGQSYALSDLVMGVLIASLLGYFGSTQISRWLATIDIQFRRALGFLKKVPSEPTVRRFLAKNKIEEFEDIAHKWLFEQVEKLPEDQRKIISFDGKVLRGSKSGNEPAKQLLSAVVGPIGVTIGQASISSKTNEIPVAQNFLPGLPLEGKTVLADALHTQTKTVTVIKKKRRIFCSASKIINAI